MRRGILWLALALAPWPARDARAGEWDLHVGPTGMRRAIVEGSAQTPNGGVGAVLRVRCQPGSDGALCVGLRVENASKERGFDFDAFEGPDAAARAQKLFSARVGPETAPLEAAVTGSFVPDPPGAFFFELCAPNHGPSDAAALAQAIAAGAGPVEIAVRDPQGREIRASFAGDAADGPASGALHGCFKEHKEP